MPHGVTKQKHLKEIEQYKEADGYVLGFGFLSGTLEDFLPPSPSFHPLLFPVCRQHFLRDGVPGALPGSLSEI